MIKRNVNARFALLSPVLPLLCLSATAQVTAPGAMDMGVDRGADATLILQNEREPDWGTQLATPEGRQQVFERKMRDARASYPDFARVLGVDTTTADKVLALLVEDEIAIATGVSEMQRNSLGRAAQYDRQIQAISKLIGAARLDTYLEYQRTRQARIHVQQFNASLLESSRLTDEQRDSFAILFANILETRLAVQPVGLVSPRRRIAPAGPRSAEEGSRDLQRYLISGSEQRIRQMEADARELMERLPQILDSEQLSAYARREARAAKQMREQAQLQRRRAGFEPDEPLAIEEVPPAKLTADTRLQLRVRVNDVEIDRTLTSRRGGSVSFKGPQGLLFEVRPRLHDSGQLLLLLQAYEPTRGGQRLVGRAETSAQITNPQQQPAYPGLGATNGDWLLLGRKAYVLDWDAKVTFL